MISTHLDKVRRVFPKILTILFFALFFPQKSYCQDETTSDFKSGLSLSIFLDNYDIWSNEQIKKSTLNALEASVPLDLELANLREQKLQFAQETNDVLTRLAYSKSPTPASLEAAIMLSERKTGKERVDVLRRANAIANSIQSRSEDTLATKLMLAQAHMEEQDFASLPMVRDEIAKDVGRYGSRQSEIYCASLAVSADISFSLGEFENADENYEKASSCGADIRISKKGSLSRLSLRRAWTSFRLTRYDAALRFLEAATPQIQSESNEVRGALSSDLAKILGVSLSEISPSVPSFHWVRNAQEFSWVGRGLVNSVLYLAQGDKIDLAMRWFLYLEPYLRTSVSAIEFYSAGVSIWEKSGQIDRLNDLRMRAIGALRADGVFALSLSAGSEMNFRRARMVLSLAKQVFDYFSGLRPEVVGKRSQQLFAGVTESFLSEKLQICDESGSILQAHRFLSLARNTHLADKLLDTIQSCSLRQGELVEFATENLEMHRKNWKDSNGSDRAWSDYRAKLLGALESYSELFAVRLLALDAASDAVSAKRFVDAERLVDMVFSTNHLVKSAENRQFEGEAIVALLVNLLSYNSHSQSVEHLAWDVHSSLLSSYGKVNRFVMELEFAIGSAVYSKSLSMRREGLIANSIEHLQSASRRFGSGGGVGRDLAFMAMRLACGTGLGGQCIDSAAAVISNPSSDVEDYFFSSHWMGKALWRSGSFLKAAEVLLRGADRAVNSELKDHSSLILEDLNLAGLIYSDLMLWEKTLEVRSLIKKATKIFDLPESSHREILAWTAGAIRSGAFEVAAELSSNSSRNSFDSKESSDFFVIFSRALSSYAKVRSNLETGVSLDMAMSDLVAHLNKDSTALSSVFLDRVSVDVFIREISDYRRRQIIDTYRSSVFNFEPSELYVRLEQLKNDIEKYQLYCKVYSFQVTIPTSDNGTCSTNDTRTMLSYAAALRNVYARAPESERSQVDSKFSTHLDIADAQLRTLLSLSANSYERKSALPSVFEYRNTNGMAILGSELSR